MFRSILFKRSEMGLLSGLNGLCPVEVQLIAQLLSYREIVKFAQCSRRLHSDLSSRFAFEKVEPLELMSSDLYRWRDVKIGGAVTGLQRLTDRSLLRYIRDLKVTGTLEDFVALPEEVKGTIREVDLSQGLDKIDIEAFCDTLCTYRLIRRLVVESLDVEKCGSFISILPRTGIIDLSLLGCGLSELGPLLQPELGLTSLDLSHCGLGTENLKLLFRALATDRTMRRLDLTGNRIPSSEVRLLADALRVNTTLEDLSLFCCEIGDDIAEISKALCDVGSVARLDSGTDGSGEGSGPSERVKGSALTSLDLSVNSISSIGARALANLYTLPGSRIRSINLMGNGIGSNGAIAIMGALSTVKSQIEGIDFRGCGIGNEGVNALSASIRTLGESCPFKSLDFDLEQSDDPEDDLYGFAFGSALLSNRSIERLTLSSVNINRRVEIAEIAHALRTNTTLTEIDFRYIDLMLEMGAISRALIVNTSLTSITFLSTKIDDVGASFLSKALRENRTLLSLSLLSNKIGDIGICAIGEALCQNSVLTSLDIGVDSECCKGALSIATALDSRHSISRLRSFDFGYSPLSDDISSTFIGISASQNRIPSLRTLTFRDIDDDSEMDCVISKRTISFG